VLLLCQSFNIQLNFLPAKLLVPSFLGENRNSHENALKRRRGIKNWIYVEVEIVGQPPNTEYFIFQITESHDSDVSAEASKETWQKEFGRKEVVLCWVLKHWQIKEAHIPPTISKNQNA